MRVLTLTQPWATLVAIGAKTIETRSWKTDYRGDLGIHAAKAFPKAAQELCYVEPFASALAAAGYTMATQLPRSAILAVAELSNCRTTEQLRELLNDTELAFGDYSDGRYGWMLPGVRRIETPIPCSGHLGLWPPEPHVRGSLVEQGFAA